MAVTLINAAEIPDDLPPGSYCCCLDESTTLAEFRARFVIPPRPHVPGDCLIQITKADGEHQEQLAADLGTYADLGDPVHHGDVFSRIEASTE